MTDFTNVKPRRQSFSNSIAPAVLMLIGLLSLGMGCQMGLFWGREYFEWSAAQNWVQVDAILTSLDLKQPDGPQSPRRRVVATYWYGFNDAEYEGHRVGVGRFSGSDSSWNEDAYARLRVPFEEGDPVACFVDPASPDRALLDRRLRPGWLANGMIMFAVCSVVGGGLTVNGLIRGRRVLAIRAAERRYPNQPWMWVPEWASGTIRQAWGTALFWNWFFAVGFNAIALTVISSSFQGLIKPTGFRIPLLVLFVLFGVSFLLAMVSATRSHFRIGRSAFVIKTKPGIIGGRLAGDLVIAGSASSVDSINVTLQCAHTERVNFQRRKTETVWSTSQQVSSPSRHDNRLSIPISFQIPHDCPPSGETGERTDITWRLAAVAEAPGLDLKLEFEVPIFKTEEGDTTSGRGNSALED